MVKDKDKNKVNINNLKDAEIIVSTWNDKFEENSKKCYSIKIKNCSINDGGDIQNIKFKELLLGHKRKRNEN